MFATQVVIIAMMSGSGPAMERSSAAMEPQIEEQGVYTHAMWNVKPGNEERFIAAWNAMSDVFLALERPPRWGTLIQSTTDPTLFYSFGPWQRAEDIQTMRADFRAQAAMQTILSLCDEAAPGTYRVAAQAR